MPHRRSAQVIANLLTTRTREVFVYTPTQPVHEIHLTDPQAAASIEIEAALVAHVAASHAAFRAL